MSADYALKLGEGVKPEQMAKIQEDFKERLTKFVQDYPKAEDTPDALMQLGMVSEFLGKEPEAKNWYEKLGQELRRRARMAAEGQGAIDRLGLDGQDLDLTGSHARRRRQPSTSSSSRARSSSSTTGRAGTASASPTSPS